MKMDEAELPLFSEHKDAVPRPVDEHYSELDSSIARDSERDDETLQHWINRISYINIYFIFLHILLAALSIKNFQTSTTDSIHVSTRFCMYPPPA